MQIQIQFTNVEIDTRFCSHVNTVLAELDKVMYPSDIKTAYRATATQGTPKRLMRLKTPGAKPCLAIP